MFVITLYILVKRRTDSCGVCGNNGNHDNDTHGTLPVLRKRKSLYTDGEGR